MDIKYSLDLMIQDYTNELEKRQSPAEKELFTKRYRAERLAEGLSDEQLDYIVGDTCQPYELPVNLNVGSKWQHDPYTGEEFRRTEKGRIIASPHPIWIERLMHNVATGELKVEIAYKRSKSAHSETKIIVPIDYISSNTNIVKLANLGVSVTSANARHLVQFLQDYENEHRAEIPVQKSINRFGWVGSGEFMPYTDNFIFDGGGQFDDLLNALEPCGSYSNWLDLMRDIRHGEQIAPKIMLAASFASALVKPLQCLPFFNHIWGGTEAGKTVALMVSTSVWGDPTIGKLAKSFNSTSVAQETIAGTLHSIPLVLDELQSIRNQKDFDKMIYELTEGTGRARGMANGGLRANYTWANCIISSGEQPITRDLSGGGAKNRIIEIECDGKLFENPIDVVETVKANYGHAGRRFIEQLTPDILERAKSRRLEIFRSYTLGEYTEKQSMAASLIAVAEELISELIFNESPCFTHYDLMEYMKIAEEVSKDVQAWAWFKEWIIENRDYFNGFAREVWGKETDTHVAVMTSIFNRECEKAGVSPRTLVSFMKRKDYLRTGSDNKLSITTNIDGIRSRCYQVKLSALSDEA